MKTHIDFFATFKSEFLGAKAFKNRFLRLWGTEFIGDEEVLKRHFTLYPGTGSTRVRRMCKMLGMWKSIKNADFSTVDGYYLYLNPNKALSSQNTLHADMIAEKIDMFFPYNEWKNITINYSDPSDPSKFDNWTKVDMYNYIDNAFDNVVAERGGIAHGSNLGESVLTEYIFEDDGTEFEIEVVSYQTTALPVCMSDDDWLNNLYTTFNKYTTALNIDVRIRRITHAVDPQGLVVQAITAEVKPDKLSKLNDVNDYLWDDSSSEWTREYRTDDIWLQGQMRVSAFNAPGVKTSEVLKNTLATLDTGVIEKHVSRWKKFVGAFLMVVTIAVAIMYPVAGWTFLSSLALYTGISTLVMALIQADWAKTNRAAASYMGRWIKMAGFVSMVSGIGAAIQNVVEGLAEKTLIATGTATSKAAAARAITEMSSAKVMSLAIESVTSSIESVSVSSAVTTAKNFVVNHIASIGLNVLKIATKFRQKDMESKLEDKRRYAKELADELTDSTDKNVLVSLEDLKHYTSNLERIHTRYDYDYLYEAEVSTINIGNIQRASSYKATGLNLITKNVA